MRAAMWWIDRWRASEAYARMTAEEQGLYRNLCDELFLRESGVIPDDQRILAKASGDHEAWARSGKSVLKSMKKVAGGWTNETALAVKKESERRAKKQRDYRNGLGNDIGNEPDNEVAPLEQDKEQDLEPEKNGVSRARAETIHEAAVRLALEAETDRVDRERAFEEGRFNNLAVAVRDQGKDIQAVLDSLPRPKSVGAFSASRWLSTGMTGIGRTEPSVIRLRVVNDGLEAWLRALANPKPRKGAAPGWDRGADHAVSDDEATAWDPRLGPRPEPPSPDGKGRERAA